MLNVPPTMQQTPWDCGRCEYLRVCGYYGQEPQVEPWPGTPHSGTDPLGLEIRFQQSGFRTLAGSMSVAALRHFTASEAWPVVCLIQFHGEGHYVTVRGVRDRRVYFACGTRGRNQSLAERTWLRRWSDVGRGGVTWHRFGIAVQREQ